MDLKTRNFLKGGVAAGLLAALVLPSFSFAAYAIYPGQSIAIQKSGVNAPFVTILRARLDNVSAQSLGVNIFDKSYRVDISGGNANLSTLAVGSYINITGSLDPSDTTVIRAQTINSISLGGGAGVPPPTTATGVCATGGQRGKSGGFEEPFGAATVGLVRQAMGCSSDWQFAAPLPSMSPTSNVPPNGTSINHKFLWYVWYYGWAMRAGTPEQKTDARNKLVAFFENQKTAGHYTLPSGATEVLNSSHYQIWSNAAAAARFLAVHHQDPALLQATGRWWRAEKALWDVLAQNGSIRAPGGRFHEGQPPVSPLRDANYALLAGNTVQANPDWWDQYYNVSAWMIRILLSRGDDLGGAAKATNADLPKLPYTMCLYKKGADYVYSFPKMKNTLHPLFWVASIGGLKATSYYSAGSPETSSVAAPSLPGSALTVLPGATGSAADCPAPPSAGGSSTPGFQGDGGLFCEPSLANPLGRCAGPSDR